MARKAKKRMTKLEIMKAYKAIHKNLSVLIREVELEIERKNVRGKISNEKYDYLLSEFEDLVEEKVYSNYGIDEILAELLRYLHKVRK
jgi:hypothetical protein